MNLDRVAWRRAIFTPTQRCLLLASWASQPGGVDLATAKERLGICTRSMRRYRRTIEGVFETRTEGGRLVIEAGGLG